MKPQELIKKFKSSQLLIKGGTFNLWGTPFGKHGDNFYEINEVTYNKLEDRLEIKTDYVISTIWFPSEIIEIPSKNEFWPAILEIKKASKIRLDYTFNEVGLFIEFDYITKQIDSNSDWYKNGKIKDENKAALIFG